MLNNNGNDGQSFPDGIVVKNLPASAGYAGRRLDPWFRKILWSRKRRPTTVFLTGRFYGQRSLAGYSPWGHKESDRTERVTLTFFGKIMTESMIRTYYLRIHPFGTLNILS